MVVDLFSIQIGIIFEFQLNNMAVKNGMIIFHDIFVFNCILIGNSDNSLLVEKKNYVHSAELRIKSSRASVLLSSTEILNLVYDMLKYYFKPHTIFCLVIKQKLIELLEKEYFFCLTLSLHQAKVVILSTDCRSKKVEIKN